MREFLEFVIRELIEFPDDIVFTEIPNSRMITLSYNFAAEMWAA